jgi:hypothetical protein
MRGTAAGQVDGIAEGCRRWVDPVGSAVRIRHAEAMAVAARVHGSVRAEWLRWFVASSGNIRLILEIHSCCRLFERLMRI